MIGPLIMVGAPSAIGLRPYEEGGVRRLDLAPDAIRATGLAARLDASDIGDVLPPARYLDLTKPEGRARNEDDVAAYSKALAQRIGSIVADGCFPLLLGGDCSIVLGALWGAKRARLAPVGLVYIDAHADFCTLEESPSGSACSMALALATGRSAIGLSRLAGDAPLVALDDVVHIGRRDDAQPEYGCRVLAASAALNLPHLTVRGGGPAAAAQAAIAKVGQMPGGFWIHVDADVLDPVIMPAVDTPLPDGLSLDELAELLIPLVRHPQALGLQLTIYDPGRDPDGSGAQRLASLLERVFTAQ